MTVAHASSLPSNYSFLNLRAALRPSAALALPVSVFIRFFSTVSSVPASPLMEFEAFISLEIHNASISHQICVNRASFLLPFYLYKKSSMPFFCLPRSSPFFLCSRCLPPRRAAGAALACYRPPLRRSATSPEIFTRASTPPRRAVLPAPPAFVMAAARRRQQPPHHSLLEPCARRQDLAPQPTCLASPFAGALSAGAELPCTRSSVFATPPTFDRYCCVRSLLFRRRCCSLSSRRRRSPCCDAVDLRQPRRCLVAVALIFLASAKGRKMSYF